jgi:hypothetical protein
MAVFFLVEKRLIFKSPAAWKGRFEVRRELPLGNKIAPMRGSNSVVAKFGRTLYGEDLNSSGGG